MWLIEKLGVGHSAERLGELENCNVNLTIYVTVSAEVMEGAGEEKPNLTPF